MKIFSLLLVGFCLFFFVFCEILYPCEHFTTIIIIQKLSYVITCTILSRMLISMLRSTLKNRARRNTADNILGRTVLDGDLEKID